MSGGEFDWGGRARVSEALKGFPPEWLETIQGLKEGLAARPTGRAGTKWDDPVKLGLPSLNG